MRDLPPGSDGLRPPVLPASAPPRRQASGRGVGVAPAILLLGLFAAAASPARAQPPVEYGLLDLLDVGPVEAPPCGCLAEPFALAPLRPIPSPAVGPGAPLEAPVPGTIRRERRRREWLEQRRRIQAEIRDALDGNPYSSFALGVAYSSGEGVEQNLAAAAWWYALAARQGHEQAATIVGSRYARGLGVPQDDEAAAAWFRMGAVLGDREALTALGLLHAAGRGVPRDFQRAVELWSRAGGEAASRLLGDAHACGLGATLDPGRALALYRAAPSFSALQLGDMYRRGCGAPLDDGEAARWYRSEADQGVPEAQIALSEMFLAGTGVEPSAQSAYELAALAAYRLQPGPLRDRALTLRDRAAGLMETDQVRAADLVVRALIDSHSRLP